jgi:hypothetical protein
MRYFMSLFMLLTVFLSCASWTEVDDSSRGARYIISEDEIRGSSATNAFEAIQQLRPGLLEKDQQRSIDMYSVAEVVVYLNGVRYGNKESLKSISALQIQEIRYLPASEATVKFGTDHAGGAFLIKAR